MKDYSEKIPCPKCQKIVRRGNLTKHQRTKKCKNHNDKTDTAGLTIPVTSPGKNSPSSSPVVSESNILKELNLNTEFDKMATKLNKKEDKKSGTDYKYECGECGMQFNHKAEEGTCPGCGVILE